MMHGEVRTNMSIQETKLTEIADAIRAKKGTSDPIVANDFATEITNLPSGGSGGYIDDFYKEQSQGFYDNQAADIVEVKRIWNEVGITENDATYDKIKNSKYKTTIKYLPKLNTVLAPNLFRRLFNGYEALTTIPLVDTSNAKDLGYMFSGCTNLVYVPPLDTSNVTALDYMFSNCTSLTSIPSLDTSKVTNMTNMFYYCTSLTSIPSLDTSKVTNMTNMFNYCSSLTSIPSLDTSNVTSISAIFRNCSNLRTTPTLDLSKVTDVTNMFQGCNNIENIDVINTSLVKTWAYLFSYGSTMPTHTIKTLDLSSYTPVSGFFNDSLSYQPAKCVTLLFVQNTIKRSIFFNYCKALSLESLASIVDGLDTVTTTQTVTFANIHKPTSTNASKLSEEQVTAMQNKGWTVAFK